MVTVQFLTVLVDVLNDYMFNKITVASSMSISLAYMYMYLYMYMHMYIRRPLRRSCVLDHEAIFIT